MCKRGISLEAFDGDSKHWKYPSFCELAKRQNEETYLKLIGKPRYCKVEGISDEN